MQQMMAHLLADTKAEIRTNQAKTDTNRREMRAGQELLKEEMLTKMETNQEIMIEQEGCTPGQRYWKNIKYKMRLMRSPCCLCVHVSVCMCLHPTNSSKPK
jgi:hypothetical protein